MRGLVIFVWVFLASPFYFRCSQTTWEILPLVAYANDDGAPFLRCAESVLALTQSCNNDNKAYVTLIGNGGSGFGSEFLAFLTNSLVTSMTVNRRMVFVKSKRRFEYDCPAEAAWGCYFKFSPCKDNLVDPSGIDLSKLRQINRYPRDSGSDFIVHETLMNTVASNIPGILESFQRVIKEAYAEKYPSIQDVCPPTLNAKDFKISLFAGLLAAKLYDIREETQQFIDATNEPFYSFFKQHGTPLSSLSYQNPQEFLFPRLDASMGALLRSGDLSLLTSKNGGAAESTVDRQSKKYAHPPIHHYAAIQLRLTDKQYETPPEIWRLISDMRYVARSVLMMLRDYHINHPQEPLLQHIFIATDNCSAAGELAHYLRHSSFATLPPYNNSDVSTTRPSTPLTLNAFLFVGACFHSDGKHILEEKRNWNPRHDKAYFVDKNGNNNNVNTNNENDFRPRSNALQVMADIDMLRHGAVFMGSFYSNMVRLVHYLRVSAQFRHRTSYHMVIDDPKFQDRSQMQPHF